ncbi:hypothetical protein D3C76_1611430 [compost metagenome]
MLLSATLRSTQPRPSAKPSTARMMVRTRRAMAIVRLHRSSVMIAVMCSSLMSVTGFLPRLGKTWLVSAPRKPATDLVTNSADLKLSHCSATYAKVRASLSN